MEERKTRVAFLVDYIVSDYSSTLINGVRKACRDLDLELVIFSIGELHNVQSAYDYQYAAIAALVSKQNVDGIIFASGTQMHFLTKDELLPYLQSLQNLPLVNISSEFPEIPSICVACYDAYKMIIENLINEQKCKRFGIMGVRSNNPEVKHRMDVIQNLFEEFRIPSSDICCWKANFDYQMAYNELETHWNTYKTFDFDAVLALNDTMASACIDFCAAHNLRVPKDVCVVGFDDVERSKFVSPSLTTINQEIEKQGYKAAETLYKLLKNKPVKDLVRIEASPVFRKSTERVKYSDKLKASKFAKVQPAIRRNVANSLSKEWYAKKGQFYQITGFYTDMQNDMSFAQLQLRINNDLKNFGFLAAGIVLYSSPIEKNAPFDYFNLPHKAFVLSAFDYATGVDLNAVSHRVEFDPNEEIFPAGLLKFDSEGLVATSLFHNNLQYGYLLFKPGNYDITIYDLLSKILSTIISTVYSHDLVSDEQAKFKRQYNRLGVVASTDELTGLLNRRGLYDSGETTLKFAKAMGQKGIIVYSDMDGLKKINDIFGHESGDRAIVAESIILKGNIRSNDVVARIGGDEFALICPGMEMESFERLRNQVDTDCATWSETSNSPFALSISMGAVRYPSKKSEYSLTGLLAEADIQLYDVKRKKHAMLDALSKSK